ALERKPAWGCGGGDRKNPPRVSHEIAELSAHIEVATAHLRLEHRLPLLRRVAVVAPPARPGRGARARQGGAGGRYAADAGYRESGANPSAGRMTSSGLAAR